MAERQPYPVGDLEHGQLVQLSKSTPHKYGYFGNHNSLTVATTVVDLDAPPDAVFALISVETAAIRFWLDGQDPSATVGHTAEAGDILELETSSEVHQFRAIRRDGVSATLRVSSGYA